MLWTKITLVATAALTVSACNDISQETLPTFGTSVAQNNAVQVGYAVAGPSFEELSLRFASQVDDTVHFEFNSAALSPQALVVLEQQASWLRRTPQARLRVEGHTDRVGGENYNLQLGLRRAESAVNYLVSRGISRDRLDATSTFGEQMPVVDTAQRELLNRRTVTRVAGIAIELAGGEFDGKRANLIYDTYVERPVYTLLPGGDSSNAGAGD